MIIGRRRSRFVGTIWALVGAALVVAAVLLWLDSRTVSFEVPAALLALGLAWAWWRQQAVLDRHGITTVGAFGERQILWASVRRIEVRRRSWLRASIALEPRNGEDMIPVPASAGLQTRQRDRLLEFLTDVAMHHGIVLVTASGETLSDGRTRMEEVRDRVMADAGEPDFRLAWDIASADATDQQGADASRPDGHATRRPTPLAVRGDDNERDDPDAPTGTIASSGSRPDPRMPAWLLTGDEESDRSTAVTPTGVDERAGSGHGHQAREQSGDGRAQVSPDPA